MNIKIEPAELLRAQQFLQHEAALLDSHSYNDWLTLWDQQDITFWVPANSDDADPQTSLGIIRDDRKHLEERVRRMTHRAAHALHPRSRLQRLVGNVTIAVAEGGWLLGSSFVLGEIHKSIQRSWFGRSEHTIMDTDGEWRIKHKVVYLLNNDEPLPNMTFIP